MMPSQAPKSEITNPKSNMVLEVALIEIKADKTIDFEKNIKKAQAIITQSPGYLSHEFQRCMERKNRYILLIKWTSLEAHNVGFRKSDLFQQWRGLIGEFFASPPLVEHYEFF